MAWADTSGPSTGRARAHGAARLRPPGDIVVTAIDRLGGSVAEVTRTIADLGERWVYALDNSRWDKLRALMTEDFTYRYRDVGHSEAVWFSGGGEAVRRLQGIAQGVTAVQHYLANPLVALDGDTATVAVYDLAFIAPTGIVEGQRVRTVGGVWTFSLRREGGQWLISSLLSEQAF